MTEMNLVFFDIDGTLFDHDKKLPQSTKQAIYELKEKGHEVAIATGRAPFMYEELRSELDIQTFVSYNGQYVVLRGEVLYTNPLSREAIQTLTHLANENNHPLVYMDHKTMRANVESHPYITESIDSLKLTKNHLVYDKHYFKENELYQSLLFCKEEEDKLYKENFKEFRFVRWHQFSTDVLPAGGSKAKGIQKIMDALGFSKDRVYAFGDGLNDMEMIQFVGNGVAMGNSHESLKKVAKYITKNVDEDGILHGLRMMGLL